MQLLFEALTYHRGADAPLSVLVILVVRVTLVLVTALVASQMLRRSSAAVQHRLWLWALVGNAGGAGAVGSNAGLADAAHGDARAERCRMANLRFSLRARRQAGR